MEEGKLNEVIEIIVGELLHTAQNLEEEEFVRAQNQLKSSIFMALETRSALAEDIARQVYAYGKRHSAEFICDKIDKLQPADIKKLLKRILTSPVSLLAYGPGYNEVMTTKNFPSLYAKYLG